MLNLQDADFDANGDVLLRRARVPPGFLSGAILANAVVDRDGAALVDIAIENGFFGRVAAASDTADGIDLDGRHVWPTLVDVHAHLDKAHIVERTPNPTGTFVGARDATARDRLAYWRHDDLLRRMTFGLRCAEAHGVSAIRTHLDSHEGQAETTWAAFREVRHAWRSRIALQAVGLAPIDVFRSDYGRQLADLVAASGGVLGGVTRATGGRHEDALDDLDALLDRLFTLARDRGLDVDLHVDESGDPSASSLAHVAQAALRHDYAGRVTCGHCCSLAVQDEAAAAATMALVAEAGISVVTLPTVNLYLQDRRPGRTPRWRGVAPVHELQAAGVRVAVAGDNCRDPFHAYGDNDMLDTIRQGIRILHLDHPFADAAALAGPVPAAIMGLADHGRIRVGAPANLIVLQAKTMDQVMARPQADRIVLKGGRRSGARLPSYDELGG